MINMYKVILRKLEEHDKRFLKHDKRFDSIDKKFESIDKRFDSIDKKFESIDKKFESIDKKFESIDKKFESIDKRFDIHDGRFENIINILLKHEDRLTRIEENMATKDDTRRIITTLDNLVGLYKKVDQEQTFVGKQVKRNTADIEKIKPLVGLE